MNISLWGINHKTAPVSLRERLSVAEDKLPDVIHSLKSHVTVDEMFLLSTCNRTEVCLLNQQGEQPNKQFLLQWISQWSGVASKDLESVLYQKSESDALSHLIEVASGLDSLVLGEPQIFGQMKDAYARARQLGALDKHFENYFQFVFKAAKRIRRETDIGINSVSVASSAVMLSKHLFNDLSQLNCLLVGAGEMIQLVAKHLSSLDFGQLKIANRSVANARKIAEQYDGFPLSIDEVPLALETSDILISCTSSSVPIIGKGAVEKALRKRKHRPILMIDLAVPRDIESAVESLDDIYLYTVDDLQKVVEHNVQNRELEAKKAREIIAEEITIFEQHSKIRDNADDIAYYRESVETLRQTELEKAKLAIEKGESPIAVIDAMSRNFANKVMHEPTVRMRKLASQGEREKLMVLRRALGILVDE